MNRNSNTDLKHIALSLPEQPGIYKFYSNSDELIYVGKAKDLKKRVSSYFSKKQHENNKINVLVKKISYIKHFVVENESDALLLENNLIKQYQPRYNVLLKDDKTFPWICVRKEAFPRVFMTRNVINDNSQYFGPYTSVIMVKTLLGLIKQIFKLRTCNYQLSHENIINNKFKVCLEYHLGNCLGPCVGFQEESNYNETIQEVKNILKGNISNVIGNLKVNMAKLSREYKFEEANLYKKKIEILEKYKSKSTIVNPAIKNVDAFSFILEGDISYINYLKIIDGAIIQTHTFELKRMLDESKEDLLLFAITDIRARFSSETSEVIVPFLLGMEIKNAVCIVPQRGDKKKLLDLSERNIKLYILDKQRRISEKNLQSREDRILATMKKDLRLNELPIQIECFDNSNLQGTNPVAACVVFKNAKPAKREYRKFNVKTVTGPDDYSSMKEIIYRRYNRQLIENQTLPNLIIIDGGKGQLNAAIESLAELNIKGEIPIIGIAKRLEEIYFPDDPIPLYLDKNSETLKLIQSLRDEAHRFGINFHRLKRSSTFIHSELEEYQGIGPKTIQKLLKTFKTIDRVKSATLAELSNVIGESKANKIISNYKSKL
jgi:excinuclease ABC subunit C